MANYKITDILTTNFSVALSQPTVVLSVGGDIYNLLGFSEDDFLGGKVTLQSRIHSHDQDIADALFSSEINPVTNSFNFRIRHADGRIRCVKGQYTKTVAKVGNSVTLELLLQDSKSLWHRQGDQTMMGNFKAMMDNTDDYIYFKDRNHVFTGASQALVEVTESTQHWTEFLGQTDYDVFLEEYADTYYHLEKQVFSGVKVAHDIQKILLKDGSKGWVNNRKYPIRDDQGDIIGLFGVARDITERQLAEESLRIAATIFESQEAMMVTDVNNVILRVNRAFTNITGYSPEDVVGQTPRLFKSGKHNKSFYTAMWQSLNDIGNWGGEICIKNKSGDICPEYLTITVVRDNDGMLTNYVATYSNITVSQAAADEIQKLAFYDTLTHQPNRRLLLDRLNQALAASARSMKHGVLLFLDLDHFKTINDTLGHNIGDLLLQHVAARLTACVRESDTVARFGGDEFVVLLDDLSKQSVEAAAQAQDVAEKIFYTINQPYQLGTGTNKITCSIGATLFNGHKQPTDELFKQADIALYQAKAEGRNTLRFFDPVMQEAITLRAHMESELRKAIEQHQFQLFYQIQVDHRGQALGAEALIRWQHPERGMISPLDFIPLAEETGLILPIGQWVLDTACVQLKTWQQNPLAHGLILAINVSAKQFHQDDFVEQVLATIARHDVNPAMLKLELTESMLVTNISDIITKMDTLSKIGITFSLDDFGTGYSSLQYLKKLPLHQLKIDQSFVLYLVTDTNDRAIVRTIITLADGLDIDIIAEGVETTEQRQYLLDSGCTYYQGYLFSKPVPIDEFEALLKKG